MNSPDILDPFCLILFGEWDISTTRDQLNCQHFSKPLILNGECLVQNVGDIVVTKERGTVNNDNDDPFIILYSHGPSQAAVHFCIHTFQILQHHLLPDHSLVHAGNEIRVQEASMIYGHPNYSPNEHEVIEMLGIDSRSRVNL